MKNESERLLALMNRVSDGDTVDWARAERECPAEERGLVSSLRFVSILAGLSREAPIGEGPPPNRVGHMEILEKIGEGTHGVVYRARDTRLDRDVALKLLRPETTRPDASVAGRDRVAALVEEARRLASVKHAHVVTVFAAEEVAGQAGIWMEFISGRSLADLARDHGRFGSGEITAIGLDLCRALAAVHRAGLVHQDIKAQNVMREEGGRIVLMDLGTGGATPLTMAPELFKGGKPTVRSDLYSLGVLLYHLATGSYPVTGESVSQLERAHAVPSATRLRDVRPDLPLSLVAAIEHALARDPARRHASAGEMEQALAEGLGGASGRRTRAVAVGVALVVVMIAVGLGSRWVWRSISRSSFGSEARVVTGQGIQSAGFPAGTGEKAALSGNSEPGYSIETSLFRGGVEREALQSGNRVGVGDSLSLSIRSSDSLYVYVVDEDDRGEAYLLFPASGFSPANPLGPGATHTLPGTRDGSPYYWQVTSAGGKEHIVVLASRARLVGFEREMLAVERPREGHALAYPRLNDLAKAQLRGVGGFVRGTAGAARPGSLRVSDLADQEPAGGRAGGVWIRRYDFENSPP